MNKLYFNCPYGLIPKNVMKDNSISLGAKGLFAYICAYAGSEDHSFPGRDLITHELNIGKDTFTKYMKELKDSKYIHVTQSKGQGKFANNIYYITPDKEEPYPNFSDTEDKDITNNNNTSNNNTNNNNTNTTSITDSKSNKKPTYMDLTFIEDYIDTVKITQDQYDKLVKDYGVNIVNNTIRNLDSYIVNKKPKYKDHNRVLRTWLSKNNNQNGKEHEKRKGIPSLNAEQKPKRKYGF